MIHSLKNFIRLIIGYIYSVYYGFPQSKLKIVGITGTDGKTTTSNFLYQLLTKQGFKVGLISTINAKIGEKEIDTGFHVTSPDAQVVIKLLNQMAKENVEIAILEVTSHGLAQNRFGTVNFDYSLVTNVTSEHLDYHKTYENYLNAKSKLILKSKITFLNKDDKTSYALLKEIALENNKNVKDYSLSDFKDSSFDLSEKLRDVLKDNYPGIYNQQNALGALSVFSKITKRGIGFDEILLLKDLQPLEGRFNKVTNILGLNIIIDFAHTPNALNNLLHEILNLKKNNEKIINVFGCAGLRDKQKRYEMGKISGNLSDFVIITSEDPRTENIDDINQKIIEGVEGVKGNYLVENDRKLAIEKAISMAKSGDWVVITGKGHEKSMCFGTIEVPWSDFTAVQNILNKE